MKVYEPCVQNLQASSVGLTTNLLLNTFFVRLHGEYICYYNMFAVIIFDFSCVSYVPACGSIHYPVIYLEINGHSFVIVRAAFLEASGQYGRVLCLQTMLTAARPFRRLTLTVLHWVVPQLNSLANQG